MATSQSRPQPQPQHTATMAAASLDEDPLVLATRGHVSVKPSMPPPPPLMDEDERRLNYYRQLYLASLKGDWESAKVYFKDNFAYVYTEKITIKGMNALHVASCNGHTKFVEKLLERMPEEALEMPTRGGYTALHHAAIGGHLKMAKALVRKNPRLTQMLDRSGNTPLLCAVMSFAKHKLVRYLATVTKIEVPEYPFTGCNAAELMINLTHMGYHDISLYLLRRHPSLALAASFKGETILKVLAYEPGHFHSGTKLKFWQRWIYLLPVHVEEHSALENQSQNGEAKAQVWQRIKHKLYGAMKKLILPCIINVREKRLGHERACMLVDTCLEALLTHTKAEERIEYFDKQEILHLAACCGVVEVVTASLNYFPDLIFTQHGRFLVKNAIEWRQVKIFNLVSKITALDKMLATSCYNPSISHLAAKLPINPQFSNHSNAATQMQREVQWYKAIERIAHPRIRQLTSEKGKKAFDLFSENRKEMREKAEKWMKGTSNSTMLVATLIATVTFAGVFQIPGGSDGEGMPNLLGHASFKVFVYSDALALFSSVTSVLMFLSILTSNYREEDFEWSLPTRMIIGLASLFFALATMLVAFGAGLQLLLHETFRWIWAPIIALTSVPVGLFIWLQLPLFVAMLQSTYLTIFRRENIWK